MVLLLVIDKTVVFRRQNSVQNHSKQFATMYGIGVCVQRDSHVQGDPILRPQWQNTALTGRLTAMMGLLLQTRVC